MKNRQHIFAFLIILFVTIIVFRKFVFNSLLPIPSDIITGVYYPWLNHKWGTSTGVPVKNPLPSDIPSLVYPWRLQVRQQIFQGHFPLWNDQIFSGMPLFGNFQSSVFSLSNLLLLPIRDHGMAWSLGIVLQPFLMFLAAYLFLRAINLSWLSSTFGALLYSYNGFSVAWMEYNLHGWVLIWLPLLLLSLEYIARQKKWGNILLILSVAGSIFSGYPQLTLYSFLVVAIYGFYKLYLKQINVRQISLIAVYTFIGLGVSAVQLLPGFETAKLSIRNVDTVAIAHDTRFLPISYLANLFAPDLHGNPATANYFGKGFYDNFSNYIGMVTVILSLISLISFKQHNNLKIFSLLLILLGILLSTDNIFAITIANLNVFGIKSIAARAMIISIVGFVILSSVGLDILTKNIKQKYLASPLLFLGLNLVIYTQTINPISKRNLLLPISISLAILFILLIGKVFNKIKFFVPYLFLIILVFEVSRFSDKYLSFSSKSYLFPDTPIIKTLQEQPDILFSKVETSTIIPENMWVPYGLKSAVGYDATAPIKYSQLLGMIGNKDLNHTQGRVGKIDQINKVSDLLAVNYILTLLKKNDVPDANGNVSSEFNNQKFSLISTEGPVALYEIKDSSKLLGFYSNSLSYTNNDQFVKLVNSPEYYPSTSALIKDGQTLNQVVKNHPFKVIENFPGKITISIDNDISGYLVFKENYYPGWQAIIDNKTTKIQEADYSFMGVFLNKGSHIVTFYYQPTSFKIGLLISVLSTMILIIFIRLTWKP